jgi:hypothetical protein
VIRLRGRVEYEGGRVEDFETGSAALAEWELFALRHGYPIGTAAPPMLSMLVIAHHALGVAEGFDVWRKSVVGVEVEQEGAVPPTLPAHFAGA